MIEYFAQVGLSLRLVNLIQNLNHVSVGPLLEKLIYLCRCSELPLTQHFLSELLSCFFDLCLDTLQVSGGHLLFLEQEGANLEDSLLQRLVLLHLVRCLSVLALH